MVVSPSKGVAAVQIGTAGQSDSSGTLQGFLLRLKVKMRIHNFASSCSAFCSLEPASVPLCQSFKCYTFYRLISRVTHVKEAADPMQWKDLLYGILGSVYPKNSLRFLSHLYLSDFLLPHFPSDRVGSLISAVPARPGWFRC